MDEYARQRNMLVPQDTRNHDIEIIGSGSLGGAITICLMKMGMGIENRVTVVDYDRCEIQNLPTQWFRRADVRMKMAKVEGLADMTTWVTGREIATVNARFTGAEERPVGPIVILAVDSLVERRAIWENLRNRADVSLLIDARMGGTVLEMFALDMHDDDRTEYERSLEAPEDAYRMPCGDESILYTVLGGAAFVASVLRSYIQNENYPSHIVFDFNNFLLETA